MRRSWRGDEADRLRLEIGQITRELEQPKPETLGLSKETGGTFLLLTDDRMGRSRSGYCGCFGPLH